MLVENQIIVTKWHPRNKEHLERLEKLKNQNNYN